jgi:hypothetical protein
VNARSRTARELLRPPTSLLPPALFHSCLTLSLTLSLCPPSLSLFLSLRFSHQVIAGTGNGTLPVRSGLEVSSSLMGSLNIGDVITALDIQTNAAKQLRVQFLFKAEGAAEDDEGAVGWTTVRHHDGTRLMQRSASGDGTSGGSRDDSDGAAARPASARGSRANRTLADKSSAGGISLDDIPLE